MLSSLLFCEPILFRLDIYLIPHTFSSEGLRVACGKTETGSAATSAPSSISPATAPFPHKSPVSDKRTLLLLAAGFP